MPPVCPMSAVALWWVADWVHSCKRLLGWSSALVRGGGSTGRLSSAAAVGPCSLRAAEAAAFFCRWFSRPRPAVSSVVMHYVTGPVLSGQWTPADWDALRHDTAISQGWDCTGTTVQFGELLIPWIDSAFSSCFMLSSIHPPNKNTIGTKRLQPC